MIIRNQINLIWQILAKIGYSSKLKTKIMDKFTFKNNAIFLI